MRIVVCVKQVPAVGALRFDERTKTIQREGVPLELNSFDARALSRAAALKSVAAGVTVTALALGPPQAKNALLEALALGADRGVLLTDPAFRGSDTLATARALAAFLQRSLPDVILCGRYSVDAETSQVGPELAALLGIPHVSLVSSLALAGTVAGTLDVERETDTGRERLRIRIPALLTVTESVAPERFPSKEEKDAAAARPIDVYSAADLGLASSAVGFPGSPTWVRELVELPSTRQQMILNAPTVQEAVEKLVQHLATDFDAFGDWRIPEPPKLAKLPERSLQVAPRDILVLGEVRDGIVQPVTWELTTKAKELAWYVGGDVILVLLATQLQIRPQEFVGRGIDRVLLAQGAYFEAHFPWEHAACLAQILARVHPRFVLGPSTAFGRDVLPRLAAALGLGLTADCIDLGVDDTGSLLQYKPAFGGSIVATISSRTLPEMATVRPGVFAAPPLAPDAHRAPRFEAVEPPRERFAFGVELLERVPLPDLGADLDHADVVVGVGKGVGAEGVPSVRFFAHRIGAALCTTRDVADEGWLPRQLQVGLTGRSIAPKLYIALGIRGAFEHIVGVRRAGIIVAVNRNARAPIFRHCDLGIAADLHQVLPLLEQGLHSIRRRS